MPQVLEAPEVQVEEREPTAIATGGRVEAARKGRLISAKRPILSFLNQLGHKDVPPCADPSERYESAIDYLYRIDPYLCIKSFTG